MERLDTIPGVNRTIAQTLLAEVGMDLGRFPTTDHLASWAGMCPGNDESAGKRRSGKTRKGSPWLRTALFEAAHGAARSQNTCLWRPSFTAWGLSGARRRPWWPSGTSSSSLSTT
ncbi:MAG: IS110 family transposase [Chloroflexota bacterium]|nr:IS110 family transposase [Chloroflexota bacterium]